MTDALFDWKSVCTRLGFGEEDIRQAERLIVNQKDAALRYQALDQAVMQTHAQPGPVDVAVLCAASACVSDLRGMIQNVILNTPSLTGYLPVWLEAWFMATTNPDDGTLEFQGSTFSISDPFVWSPDGRYVCGGRNRHGQIVVVDLRLKKEAPHEIPNVEFLIPWKFENQELWVLKDPPSSGPVDIKKKAIAFKLTHLFRRV